MLSVVWCMFYDLNFQLHVIRSLGAFFSRESEMFLPEIPWPCRKQVTFGPNNFLVGRSVATKLRIQKNSKNIWKLCLKTNTFHIISPTNRVFKTCSRSFWWKKRGIFYQTWFKWRCCMTPMTTFKGPKKTRDLQCSSKTRIFVVVRCSIVSKLYFFKCKYTHRFIH